MRIISQNGMADYPYEQCMIFVNYKERTKLCIAMCGDSDDNYAELGEYDSEDDAKFALRYINSCFLNRFGAVEAPNADLIHQFRIAYEEHKNKGETIAEFYKRMKEQLGV
jgi:hypothetical protein